LNAFNQLIKRTATTICCFILLLQTGCSSPSPSLTRTESTFFETHADVQLVSSRLPALHAAAEQPRDLTPLVSQGDRSYENVTLSEDITWRGTILIRGFLVVAPQATVRMEPGTTVRFMKSPIMRQSPRLIVMGRLQCNGTPENPILFSSNYAEPAKGDWGGILLLSSEKRNQFDNIQILGADTGIEARFSSLAVRGGRIDRTLTGMLLHDSTATLSGLSIQGADVALDARDSELDIKESTLMNNRSGIVAQHVSLVMTAVSVRDCTLLGIAANECRVRVSGCEVAGNGGGARLTGGEGQILRTRFVRNRELALSLIAARIRVNQSLFAETRGDGIRMSDGRSIVWGCSFMENSGYNLVNAGPEQVSAVQNWWGSNKEAAIIAKLFDAAADKSVGPVLMFPWLTERPVSVP